MQVRSASAQQTQLCQTASLPTTPNLTHLQSDFALMPIEPYLQPELTNVRVAQSQPPVPITCLGLTFETDAERRAYFRERLREKLQDPAFRAIEGFPIGTDEAILALSDPPYYTACPNPFLAEIMKWQEERAAQTRRSWACPTTRRRDGYHREPFAADVSEGKNDPIYNAHSYHTKVPHKAIMRYILHYTDPGDIVLRRLLRHGHDRRGRPTVRRPKAVESLGYRVDGEGMIYEGRSHLAPGSAQGGAERPSPAATFIAYNYNTPVDAAAFEREAKRILAEVEQNAAGCTRPGTPTGSDKGRDQLHGLERCFPLPECSGEIVFLDEGAGPKNAARQGRVPLVRTVALTEQAQPGKVSHPVYGPGAGTASKPQAQARPIEYKVHAAANTPRAVDDARPGDFRAHRAHAIARRCRSECAAHAHVHHGSRLAPQRVSRICIIFSAPRPPRVARAVGEAQGVTDPRLRAFCCSPSSRRSGACRCSIVRPDATSRR